MAPLLDRMISGALRRCWSRCGAAAAAGAVMAVSAARAQTPIPPTTQDFATSAAQSDEYERLSGEVAVAQSRDPRILTFAREMIADHAKTSDAMRRAAMAAGLPPPPAALSSDGAAMLSALQSLRGTAFDKAYIRQQILAHDQALAVETSYASLGSDPALKRAARDASPVIQTHLKRAEQISKTLEGL